MTPALGIYTGTQYLHRHLACYTWYMIYDTGTRYLHRHSVLTPTLAMLYLTPVLPCYIWHMIPNIDTCHAIFDTWYMTPVFGMLYLPPDIYNTWYLTPDTWNVYYLGIHDYYVTRHLALLYLLYSCISWTPVLLNSCTSEPLEKVLILHSWYYTPVNSRSWKIMVILYTLVNIIFGQYI